ncbi:hypothetical protein BGX27_010723, partial [Mortierella sp. AM989]
RTFNKFSTNLYQYGSWCCVFEETKKQHQESIELHLSLNWVPSSNPPSGIKQIGHNSAQELLSRIRSVKIRSDSTLSDLLVTHLDGGCLLQGEFIKVRLQPDRVLRNGRYKFRIGFYTKVIPTSGFRPFSATFLGIDPEFDPVSCRPNESPDVTFQFPASDLSSAPTVIMAHSSVIKQSQYFAHRVAEVVKEQTCRGIPFNGIACAITEFNPEVFRAMLMFLYTGKLRVKNISDRAGKKTDAVPPDLSKKKLFELKNRGVDLKGHVQQPGKVYFEDLYRISERYEISALKELSLKAIQCNLSMSIAISTLTKLPGESLKNLNELSDKAGDREELTRQGRLNMIQIQLARSSIKEYIQFFGMYATIPTIKRHAKGDISPVQESLEIIHYIGDCVLDSIGHV